MGVATELNKSLWRENLQNAAGARRPGVQRCGRRPLNATFRQVPMAKWRPQLPAGTSAAALGWGSFRAPVNWENATRAGILPFLALFGEAATPFGGRRAEEGAHRPFYSKYRTSNTGTKEVVNTQFRAVACSFASFVNVHTVYVMALFSNTQVYTF